MLACFGLGTLELPLAGENRVPRVLVPASGPHSVFSSSYVGLSQQFLAVAAQFYQIAWMSRAAPERVGEMAVDSPVNIDVWQDRLLLIGYRTGPDGKGLTDGAMDTDWEDIRHVAGLMKFDPIDFTARLENTPLSGPVEGTICIKRKSSKVERRYRYDDNLINGDSAWSVVFGCDLASGAFGSAN